MRKTLIILIAIISFTLLFSGVALATNGPHQGPGMPQDTDACAGCHRAHTGTVAGLLKDGENVYAFCTSCHNGTGANTNVEGGIFTGAATGFGTATQNNGTAGTGLNGGGFVQAANYTGRSGRTDFANVSSKHDMEATGTAWGGGANGPGTPITLKCTSCHDPHGTKNTDGTERYRILLNKVNGTDVGAIKSNEGSPKNYTADQYNTGTTGLCAACHTQYISGSSPYDAGDDKGIKTRYRHAVPKNLSAGDLKTGNGATIAANLNSHIKLPIEQAAYDADAGGSDVMACLTCHQAHGTRAAMSDNSKVSPASSSTLLRLNNRGVCQDCHQK